MVEPPPPPVPAPDPTVRRHDGFYLRMGLGAGYMLSSIDPPPGDLSARGGGVALDFAIGGTVAHGLVIGGGFFLASAGNVTWKGDPVSLVSASDTVKGGEASLGLIGAFIDYYPNPNDGFHLMGALGIGTQSYTKAGDSPIDEDFAGGGGGFMLGIGYEAWVGSQWSLGGVARVVGTSTSIQGEQSGTNFGGRGIAPGLLFVATHH